MGIEHPDITEALRTGYPLGYRYEEDEETWEELDLWTDEW